MIRTNHNTVFPAVAPSVSNIEKQNVYLKELSPLAVGDILPGKILLRQTAGNNAEAFSYSRKPVLLYFYEADWGLVAQAHLRQLNRRRADLQYLQAEIVVVTSYSADRFKELSWKEEFNFTLYEDPGKHLATALGIYATDNPSWIWYAGVDRNVPLPSLYVLGSLQQVTLAYPNKLLQPLPLDNAIEALNGGDRTFNIIRKIA